MTIATESSEDHHQQVTRTRGSKKREITLDNIRTYMPANRPQKRPYAVSTEELQTGHSTFQTLTGAGAPGQESSVSSGPTTAAAAAAAAAASLVDEEDDNAAVAAAAGAVPSAQNSDVPPNLPTPFRWKGMTNGESNHQLALLCQALIEFVEESKVLYTSKFKLMRAFIAAEAYPPHMKGIDELMIKNKLFFAYKKAQTHTKSGLRLAPHEELLLKTIAALEDHVAQSKTPAPSTNGKTKRPSSSSDNPDNQNEGEDNEEQDDEQEPEEEGEVAAPHSLTGDEEDTVITESTEPASAQPEVHPATAPTVRSSHNATRKRASIPSGAGVSSFRTVQSTFRTNSQTHFEPNVDTANPTTATSTTTNPATADSAIPATTDTTSSGELIGLDPLVLSSLTKTMDVLGRHINSMAANQVSAGKGNPRQLKALSETLATLLGDVVECKSSLRSIESKIDYLDKKIDVLNKSYRDGLLQMQKSLIESLLRATMPGMSGGSGSM